MPVVAAAAVGIAAAAHQYADDVRHLTLTEAVHLAISQNRALKIARLKVAENEQKKVGQRSSYFPSLKNESNILHVTDLQNLNIPVGAFGTVGGVVRAFAKYNPAVRDKPPSTAAAPSFPSR